MTPPSSPSSNKKHQSQTRSQAAAAAASTSSTPSGTRNRDRSASSVDLSNADSNDGMPSSESPNNSTASPNSQHVSRSGRKRKNKKIKLQYSPAAPEIVEKRAPSPNALNSSSSRNNSGSNSLNNSAQASPRDANNVEMKVAKPVAVVATPAAANGHDKDGGSGDELSKDRSAGAAGQTGPAVPTIAEAVSGLVDDIVSKIDGAPLEELSADASAASLEELIENSKIIIGDNCSTTSGDVGTETVTENNSDKNKGKVGSTTTNSKPEADSECTTAIKPSEQLAARLEGILQANLNKEAVIHKDSDEKNPELISLEGLKQNLLKTLREAMLEAAASTTSSSSSSKGGVKSEDAAASSSLSRSDQEKVGKVLEGFLSGGGSAKAQRVLQMVLLGSGDAEVKKAAENNAKTCGGGGATAPGASANKSAQDAIDKIVRELLEEGLGKASDKEDKVQELSDVVGRNGSNNKVSEVGNDVSCNKNDDAAMESGTGGEIVTEVTRDKSDKGGVAEDSNCSDVVQLNQLNKDMVPVSSVQIEDISGIDASQQRETFVIEDVTLSEHLASASSGGKLTSPKPPSFDKSKLFSQMEDTFAKDTQSALKNKPTYKKSCKTPANSSSSSTAVTKTEVPSPAMSPSKTTTASAPTSPTKYAKTNSEPHTSPNNTTTSASPKKKTMGVNAETAKGTLNLSDT